jgi:hypothetical protein
VPHFEGGLPNRFEAPAPDISLASMKGRTMGFDQYHEPVRELSQKVRTFARMAVSVIEETEAISWYEQRISVEKDRSARSIMMEAQEEEFKHFAMALEFLVRQKPKLKVVLQKTLFTKGDIVKAGKQGEKAEERVK